jgi:lysyl-tRNA synthetase, class II
MTAPALPTRFPDRDEIAVVRVEADALAAGEEGSETRRLAGRVLGRRGHGRLVFLDLVDRSGQIQLLCSADRAGEVNLDLGDVVGAVGKPAKTRRGEPSLAVDELELLAKIRRPLPDTYHGLVDAETRYRKRYLDLLVNEETRRDFVLRSRIVASIRRRLDEAGFVEVETPMLQPRYGGAFAEPFVTRSKELETDLYLRIATELYLKRLIVGGLEKVYELGKDFRNEGVSFKHNPEFTMVEWYEAYADYTDEMRRVEEMVAFVAEQCDYDGPLHLLPPWRRVTLRDAIHEKTGLDVLAHRDRDALVAAIDASERVELTTEDRTWSQLVDDLLSKYVEPEIADPVFIVDYPVELSPFAKAHRSEPGLTERFEVFADGMEFGNAFTELNDPEEQRARFDAQVRHAAAGDEEAQPFDEAFLAALEHGMPPTGGVGVGVDRLVMIMTGRRSIREVVLFPAMRD